MSRPTTGWSGHQYLTNLCHYFSHKCYQDFKLVSGLYLMGSVQAIVVKTVLSGSNSSSQNNSNSPTKSSLLSPAPISTIFFSPSTTKEFQSPSQFSIAKDTTVACQPFANNVLYTPDNLCYLNSTSDCSVHITDQYPRVT